MKTLLILLVLSSQAMAFHPRPPIWSKEREGEKQIRCVSYKVGNTIRTKCTEDKK